MQLRVRDADEGQVIQVKMESGAWATLSPSALYPTVEEWLDFVLGPQSRMTIMNEYEQEKEGGSIRDAAGVSQVRMPGLSVEEHGGDRDADLLTREELHHESESADGDEDRDRPQPSAQMERVPRMETNETSGVSSDAEKVAQTMDQVIAIRRRSRKEHLAEIAEHERKIADHRAVIADMDRVIKQLEKTASKLRKG